MIKFYKILIISPNNLKLGPEWRLRKTMFTLSSLFLGGHGTALLWDFFWWQGMLPGTSVPNALCSQWWLLKAPLLEVWKKKVSFSYIKGKIVSGNTRVPQIIKWPTHLQKSEAIASSLKLSILWTWTSWLESHADYNTCQSEVKKICKDRLTNNCCTENSNSSQSLILNI